MSNRYGRLKDIQDYLEAHHPILRRALIKSDLLLEVVDVIERHSYDTLQAERDRLCDMTSDQFRSFRRSHESRSVF